VSTITVRPLATPLAGDLDAERSRAVRALLRAPLLVAARCDREDWFAVLRQQGWLRTWFADQADWFLRIDARAGYARLEKRIAWQSTDATRGAVLPGSGRSISQRAYTLLCLVAAELVATNLRQVLVRDLAERVAELAAAEALAPYDATRRSERQALVDALRLLEDYGVLHLDDGSAEAYLDDGDALYTINPELLGSLVIARGLPGGAPDHAVLGTEPEPLTDEGRRRRQRQHVTRRLLDDAVVYAADLDAEGAALLRGATGRAVAAAAEQAGLRVERRTEGMAAIDPDGDLTDIRFPSTGTVAHAALLACELFSDRARDAGGNATPIRRSDLEDLVSDLLDAHRDDWASRWTDGDDAVTELTDAVVHRLVSFRLARVEQGWALRPLPALARFAAEVGVQLSLSQFEDPR